MGRRTDSAGTWETKLVENTNSSGKVVFREGMKREIGRREVIIVGMDYGIS